MLVARDAPDASAVGTLTEGATRTPNAPEAAPITATASGLGAAPEAAHIAARASAIGVFAGGASLGPSAYTSAPPATIPPTSRRISGSRKRRSAATGKRGSFRGTGAGPSFAGGVVHGLGRGWAIMR